MLKLFKYSLIAFVAFALSFSVNAQELLSKRTYNSKTHDNGNGSFTLEAHGGHIHYKDTQGDFKNVDYTLEDMGTYWRMVKANYRLYVAKDFDAPDLIRFDNRFEGANHSIYYEPHSLRWVNNSDLSDMSTWRTAQAVTGVLSENTIRYPDAFGPGIHFEITLRRSGFKKEVVIDALTDLVNPPTVDHRLTLLSRYRGDNLTIVKEDGGASDWDSDIYYDSLEGFRVEEIGNRVLKSFIKKAYAVDSAENENRIQLKVFWKLHNGSLWQAKILPTKAQFQVATFPVRADTTTSYYAGAGDGHVNEGGNATWAGTHDATTGNNTDATGDTATVEIGYETTPNFYTKRGFIPIDTSGIPDTATISAATLNIYPTYLANGDNDGEDYLAVVETFQASTSTLATADFEDCGSDNGTAARAKETPIEEGSDQLDISALGTGAYETFTLDATGRGWINKTGITKIGIREGHDLLDSSIDTTGGNLTNEILFSTSEETAGGGGQDQDPYLEVVYTGLSIPIAMHHRRR